MGLIPMNAYTIKFISEAKSRPQARNEALVSLVCFLGGVLAFWGFSLRGWYPDNIAVLVIFCMPAVMLILLIHDDINRTMLPLHEPQPIYAKQHKRVEGMYECDHEYNQDYDIESGKGRDREKSRFSRYKKKVMRACERNRNISDEEIMSPLCVVSSELP
jgi:hypothetical protein